MVLAADATFLGLGNTAWLLILLVFLIVIPLIARIVWLRGRKDDPEHRMDYRDWFG
jgi:hypothetical protein